MVRSRVFSGRAPRLKPVWLVANALGMKWSRKVHFSHVTSRGQPQTPSRSRTSSEAFAVHSALQAECTASIWPYEHLINARAVQLPP